MVGRKKTAPVTHPTTYNIPRCTNHYNTLSTDEGYATISAMSQCRVVQSGDKVIKSNSGNKVLNRIVILGDSHVRGCASEVQHNLDSSFVTQGMVKPGANIKEIITPPTSFTKKLSKKDVVVIWGGTHDISKNESKNAILQIESFVQNHNNTNIIVMGAPCRYDLDPSSCVNNEVKVFNRKLRKYLKLYTNVSMIDIDTNRELFTKHGLHMNNKRKEQMSRKIGLEIKCRLKNKGETPIIMTDKLKPTKDDKGNWRNEKETTNQVHQNISEEKNDEDKEEADKENSSSERTNYKSPKRPRRHPVTRHKDFLWEDKSNTKQG